MGGGALWVWVGGGGASTTKGARTLAIPPSHTPPTPHPSPPRRPESLRARYGESPAKPGVHCTDLPEDGPLEVEALLAGGLAGVPGGGGGSGALTQPAAAPPPWLL